MAQLVSTNLDFQKVNAIVNALIHPIVGDVATPTEGQIWYNSSTEALRLRLSASTITIADMETVDDLVTLSGVAANAGDLGSFTGATIADTSTIKAALQALETAMEAINGVTNLTLSQDTTTATVASDTGTNAIIPTATTSLAGLMSSALWDKLNGITALADVSPAVIDDDTMATASASNVASAESIVAYIASEQSGVTRYKGGYNAATNTPALDATPIATQVGDQYTVTAAGDFFTVAVEVGDLLIAEVATATLVTDWTIVNRNIDAASETVAGIAEIATQAETNAGTNDTTFITPLKLATRPRGVAADCTAAATTTVTHSLGTVDVLVNVVEVSTGASVLADVERTGINAVDVTLTPTPTAGQFRILVMDLV
jgi:hypothetical protein